MRAQLTYYPDSNSRFSQYKIYFDHPSTLLTPEGIQRTLWIDRTRITGLSKREKGKFGVGKTFIIEVIAMKRMKNKSITRVEVKMLGKKKPVKEKVSTSCTPNWDSILGTEREFVPLTDHFIIQDDPDGS